MDKFPELLGGTRELRKIFFDKVPVIPINNKIEKKFQKMVTEIQKEYTTQKAILIDNVIFEMYNLTAEEINTIGFIEIE
jgi:hypothetical protein